MIKADYVSVLKEAAALRAQLSSSRCLPQAVPAPANVLTRFVLGVDDDANSGADAPPTTVSGRELAVSAPQAHAVCSKGGPARGSAPGAVALACDAPAPRPVAPRPPPPSCTPGQPLDSALRAVHVASVPVRDARRVCFDTALNMVVVAAGSSKAGVMKVGVWPAGSRCSRAALHANTVACHSFVQSTQAVVAWHISLACTLNQSQVWRARLGMAA